MQDLQRACVQLATRLADLDSRAVHLERSIGAAKARLACRDTIEGVLGTVAEQSRARSVGHLETLLSGIVQDVMPEQGRVRLHTSLSRNLPALQVSIEALGKPERITSGCLTNVVSTGLRYAALARAGRRFILLDEPDCWINPNTVPDFARVIAQLAGQAGLQTLVITHHDLQAFGPQAHILGLRRAQAADGHAAVVVQPRTHLPDWPVGAPGIRALRLRNIKTHVDNRLDFAPGVTVITGPNGAGKSVITEVFRAVALGEHDDSLIRHDAPEAEAIFHLVGGATLNWSFRRRGSPRERYVWRDAQGNVLESQEGAGVPDWLVRCLGIDLLDGLDPQIGQQQDPVFLLNESPRTRAQILNVGRESGYLDAMFGAYKALLREDTARVKHDERALAAVRAGLALRPEIERVLASERQLQQQAQTLAALDANLTRAEDMAGRLDLLNRQVRRMRARLTILADLPDCPAPGDPRPRQIARRLQQARRRVQAGRTALVAVHLPRPPALPDLAAGQRLLTALRRGQTRQRLQLPAELMPAPPLAVLDRQMALCQRLTRLQQGMTTLRQRREQAARAAQSATDRFQDQLATQGHCPLCGVRTGDEHAH